MDCEPKCAKTHPIHSGLAFKASTPHLVPHFQDQRPHLARAKALQRKKIIENFEVEKKIPTAHYWCRYSTTTTSTFDSLTGSSTTPHIPKMVTVNNLLFESAVGFAIFDVKHQADAVGLELPEVKESIKALDKFGKMVQLRSFNPWT